ncbi:hypothetical protein ON010_g7132 [Phytophthora cinnamomi]|nr:hypothetical protein ON010_g7132 [Phytophthora cinnamomi]
MSAESQLRLEKAVPPITRFLATPKPPESIKQLETADDIYVVFSAYGSDIGCAAVLKVPEIAPEQLKPVRVPNDVILGWAAVWMVPVRFAVDSELIPVILPLPSNTIAFDNDAVPGVIPIRPEKLSAPNPLSDPSGATTSATPGVDVPAVMPVI